MPELGSYPTPQAVRPRELDLGGGAGKTACLCLGSMSAGPVSLGLVFVEKESEQRSKCPILRSQP